MLARVTRISLLATIMACSVLVQAQNLPRVNIGIVSDGLSPRFGQQTEIIKREIIEITRGEFDVVFPEHMQLSGDWDVKKIRDSIDRLFNDSELDLLIATGPAGSQELISRDNLPLPAIATAVLDVSLQEAPLENGRSGVKNLNYLASPKSFERDLLAFREIVEFFIGTLGDGVVPLDRLLAGPFTFELRDVGA